jgi:transporter family protein
LLRAVLIAVIVIASTFGELCVARAVRTSNSESSLRLNDVLHTLLSALVESWMWVGIVSMSITFFALLLALSRYGVSYIVPTTALSYPLAGLGGRWFLDERVSRSRWISIGLITVGVLIVLLSGRSK